MFGFLFQETSYLAVRRSMFLTSFVLAIVLIYQVDIPVPFTGNTGSADEQIGHQISHQFSTKLMAVYLIYLVVRWKPHQKKYLRDLVANRSKDGDLSKLLDKGSNLLERLQQVGDNPLQKLLPAQDEISTFQSKFTNFFSELDACTRKTMGLSDELGSLSNLEESQKVELRERPLHMQATGAEEYSQGVLLQIAQDVTDMGESLTASLNGLKIVSEDVKSRISGHEINEWSNDFKVFMNAIKGDSEKLLVDLSNDAKIWDVWIPLSISLFMIFLTIIEFFFSLDFLREYFL